jgi:hypothetical protein
LVVGENPYENAFEVDIEKNRSISKFKDAIKEKIHKCSLTLIPKTLNNYGRLTIPLKKKMKNLTSLIQKLTLISRRSLVVWNCFYFQKLADISLPN